MAKIKGKQIANDTLTNANIKSDAAIALSKLSEAVLQADGGQALTGDLPAGGNKITGLATGTAAGDAATKGQLDAAIDGLKWSDPVAVRELVGNLTVLGLDGLTPTTGDAYVSTDAGTPTAGASDALVAGDLTEFDGTQWKKIVSASGGFPPAGTRALLSIQTALISPYTEATDDGKLVEFDGTSLTALATGEAVDGAAVLVTGDPSVFENQAYVYDGAVPAGTWVQFTGGGAISFGTPVALGAANDAGSGTDSARSNHVHKRDTYTEEEIPTETITGTDTAMATALSATPLLGSLQLALNGLVQLEGIGNDYTVSGDIITWLAATGTAVDQETTDVMVASFISQG